MSTSEPRSATELDKAIGARVRARRRELGVSQTTLAGALGVTFQQIQKYENGTNRIACGTLVRIGQSLEAPPAWFLGDGRGTGIDSVFDDPVVLALARTIGAIKSERVRARALALIEALAGEEA